jgi:hypothetical protein
MEVLPTKKIFHVTDAKLNLNILNEQVALYLRKRKIIPAGFPGSKCPEIRCVPS